jgi:hypothetical protein
MRIRKLRTMTHSAGLAVMLCLPAAANAEFECKEELWAGAWVNYNNLELAQGSGLPVSGAVSIVSWFLVDETGRVTAASQTNTALAGAVPPFDPTQTMDIRFTIQPNCTGRVTFADRSSGQTLQEAVVVCANGQRECFLTFIAPAGIVGITTLRRVDDFDAQLQARIARVADLVERIAFRLGLLAPPVAPPKR